MTDLKKPIGRFTPGFVIIKNRKKRARTEELIMIGNQSKVATIKRIFARKTLIQLLSIVSSFFVICYSDVSFFYIKRVEKKGTVTTRRSKWICQTDFGSDCLFVFRKFSDPLVAMRCNWMNDFTLAEPLFNVYRKRQLLFCPSVCLSWLISCFVQFVTFVFSLGKYEHLINAKCMVSHVYSEKTRFTLTGVRKIIRCTTTLVQHFALVIRMVPFFETSFFLKWNTSNKV